MKNFKINRRAVFGTMLAVASAVSTPAVAQDKETIKLGFIGPLSGGNASQGLGAKNGFLLAIEQANAGDSISFFEITTAAAMLAFSRAPADVLLLECGLGGRFDATNVVKRPAATVVVPPKPERLVKSRGPKGKGKGKTKGRTPRKGTKPTKKVPDLKGGGLADPYGS